MRKETMEAAGRSKSTNRGRSTQKKQRAVARSASRATTLRSRSVRPAKAASKAKSRAKGRASTPRKPARAGSRAKAGAANATTNHDIIRRWAESRGGKPVSVRGTARSKQHAGLLRIDFPGFSGAGKLEPVSWEEWFQKFDESKLSFLYQDKTKDGKQSRFFKLVKR